MQFKTKIIISLLFGASLAPAQSSKDPIWYTMMQDSSVNYYQAVRAYEVYWKGKMLLPNKDLRHSETYQAYFKTLTPDEKIEYDRICWLSKVFRNWMREASGRSFSTIANLPFGQFSLSDDALAGIHYYRLKIVERDGQGTYSNIQSVTIDDKSDLQLYPNYIACFVPEQRYTTD